MRIAIAKETFSYAGKMWNKHSEYYIRQTRGGGISTGKAYMLCLDNSNSSMKGIFSEKLLNQLFRIENRIEGDAE